jgi:competence protein ComEC
VSSRIRRTTALLVILALCSMGAVREFRVRPDGQTHVFVLDVGQGDSMLIRTPSGKQIVIDGGPDRSALTQIARHLSCFDRSIDQVIL